MSFESLVAGALLLALLVDHFIIWRAFQRTAQLDTARARRTWWLQTAALLWTCSALVLGIWNSRGVPPGMFDVPNGWRLWLPLALIVVFVSMQMGGAIKLARGAGDKTRLRAQLGTTGQVLPHGASELPAWFGMSVTAGFCEELMFRGFLIWWLQPLAGWWAAALAALAIFAAAHAYQGATGVVRSAMVGTVLTLVVFVSQSLWPAIVLHAALDWMGGYIGWLIVREPAAPFQVAAPSAPR